jgi:ferredoxin-NADP reductase
MKVDRHYKQIRALLFYTKTFLGDPNAEVACLFAAGTGITPMVKIIKWFWDKVKKAETSRKVVLIYWNKSENDIIWHDVWKELAAKESSWFYFFSICTEPGPKYTGLTGRPSSKQIQDILDSISNEVSNSKAKQGYDRNN